MLTSHHQHNKLVNKFEVQMFIVDNKIVYIFTYTNECTRRHMTKLGEQTQIFIVDIRKTSSTSRLLTFYK